MKSWTANEIAMVESAIKAGITPTSCGTWFPNRSRQAIRSCFERTRIRLGIHGTRGRPASKETLDQDGIDDSAVTVAVTNAREGSRALWKRQLETGQYFPAARAAWLDRHGMRAA